MSDSRWLQAAGSDCAGGQDCRRQPGCELPGFASRVFGVSIPPGMELPVLISLACDILNNSPSSPSPVNLIPAGAMYDQYGDYIIAALDPYTTYTIIFGTNEDLSVSLENESNYGQEFLPPATQQFMTGAAPGNGATRFWAQSPTQTNPSPPSSTPLKIYLWLLLAIQLHLWPQRLVTNARFRRGMQMPVLIWLMCQIANKSAGVSLVV